MQSCHEWLSGRFCFAEVHSRLKCGFIFSLKWHLRGVSFFSFIVDYCYNYTACGIDAAEFALWLAERTGQISGWHSVMHLGLWNTKPVASEILFTTNHNHKNSGSSQLNFFINEMLLACTIFVINMITQSVNIFKCNYLLRLKYGTLWFCWLRWNWLKDQW